MAPDEPKPDVMSSLPRTRPQRRSAKRDAPANSGVRATAKPRAKPAAAKAAAKPKARAAAKPKARPRMKVAANRIPAAGFAPPPDPGPRTSPSGVELVGTAIQAAGELAQIGLAVGGQALKSALGRVRGSQ